MSDNNHPVRLRAGILDLVYHDGAIRYIRSGPAEIIRMIYPALRDHEWLNIHGVIRDEKADIMNDSFLLSYNINYTGAGIDFKAKVTISGTRDNKITYRFEGEAITSFMKNRAGLCLLHPAGECAGKHCLITHSDKSTESQTFPYFISPHQPFYDVKEMQWTTGGLICLIQFTGDVFETEDQRNWTDDSFKTYSTPLSLPFPVRLKEGEKIFQEIELKVRGQEEEIKEASAIDLTAENGEYHSFPSTGICQTWRKEPLNEDEINAIRKTGFSHYRVEIDLTNKGWQSDITDACTEAALLNLPVELALFIDGNAVEQCTALTGLLAYLNPDIILLIVYHKYRPCTPDELSDAIIPLLRSSLPGIRIACGTNANFAQINRNRPRSLMPDLRCWSIHPQEHLSDYATLVENLCAQACTVESARDLWPQQDIWITPVTIARRFNANLGFHTDINRRDDYPASDVRLKDMRGACWAAGSFKYLAEAGVAGISFLETAGDAGIIGSGSREGLEGKMNGKKVCLFPVFHLFRFLLKHKEYKILTVNSTDRLSAEALGLVRDNLLVLAVINYTPEKKEVRINLGADLQITGIMHHDDKKKSLYRVVRPSQPAMNNHGGLLILKPFSITFIRGIYTEKNRLT